MIAFKIAALINCLIMLIFAGIEIDNILKECKIPIRYYSFLSLCIIGAVALGILIGIITISLYYESL